MATPAPATTPADSNKCRLEIRALLWFSTLTPPLTSKTKTVDIRLSGRDSLHSPAYACRALSLPDSDQFQHSWLHLPGCQQVDQCPFMVFHTLDGGSSW